MRTQNPRFKGEKGLAIIMTGLMLVPLMVFAAFGVDMASWYSRISQLQKAADAAALAGTVWMPNLNKAAGEATASLRANGFVHDVDGIIIDIDRGSTPTSLRVEITDTDADRIFSQVFRGQQQLTRHAEAEYNLPIPLGSPLNYFGGDRTKTQPPQSFSYSVSWPGDYQTREPVNRPCNIGTSSSQGLGTWNPTGSFDPGGFVGSRPQCRFGSSGELISGPGAGTSAVPPPDHRTRVPNNGTSSTGCRIREDGTGSVLGRWRNSTFSTSTGGSAGACSWPNWRTDPASIVPDATTRLPANQPCRVGYETSGPGGGFWNGVYFSSPSAAAVGGSVGAGNQLCEWAVDVAMFDSTPPNPIASDRSPGFWAAIGGPGDVSAFGDAYSARCTGSTNCGGTPNQMHSEDGYWYVIKMPATGATSTTVRVFDAAYNSDASSTTLTGDTRGNFSGSNGFTTTYRVYRQTNPLDINQRVALGSDSADQTPGSCHWELEDEAEFRVNWTDLCTITPNNGEIYLLNVKTDGSSDTDGVNGYAVEAVSAGAVQPAVYAFGTMAMRNNIDAGEAEFYLAEVGPQYAGKTLVVELFDSGDAQGNAYLRPVSPGTSAGEFTNIDSSSCSYTSSPSPNPGIFGGSPDGGQTSPPVSNPTTPGLTNCRIQTTSSGTQQFNDNWLTIRVEIPADYTCTLGVNPETMAGSCWWGIKYNFSSSSNDVTTWRARIEGNPLQLTQ